MRNEFRTCSFLLLGLTIVLSLAACAGNPEPDLQWSQTFPYAKYAAIYSSQHTTDGGYILCGDAYSRRGIMDILMIKTDADGNKLWDKTFGGEAVEQARSIQQAADGGYIVCGSTYSHRPGGYSDIWLIKTDADGNKLWDKTFSVYNIRSWGHSVQRTKDGGYILCGEAQIDLRSHSCICLIKTDASGNKLWGKTFGEGVDSRGRVAQQTTDGGYIVCGTKTTSSDFLSDVWLIKTDADGNKLWDKTFGGERSDGISSVQQTEDDGYIICGYQQPYDIGMSAIWLIKTDADGNKIWDKTFGGGVDSESRAAQQTTDGGYIILGTTHHFSLLGHFLGYRSGSIMWLIKTDADGNKLWDATFRQGPHEGHVVQETIDGGYMVCLSGGDNIILFKIAPDQ